METQFFAPYFGGYVILTAERRSHIAFRHADIGSGAEVDELIRETLTSPIVIQKSVRDIQGLIFVRWHPKLHNGKFLLVVVIDEPERKWVITAYSSHEIPEGEILWQQI